MHENKNPDRSHVESNENFRKLFAKPEKSEKPDYAELRTARQNAGYVLDNLKCVGPDGSETDKMVGHFAKHRKAHPEASDLAGMLRHDLVVAAADTLAYKNVPVGVCADRFLQALGYEEKVSRELGKKIANDLVTALDPNIGISR